MILMELQTGLHAYDKRQSSGFRIKMVLRLTPTFCTRISNISAYADCIEMINFEDNTLC